MKQRRYWFFFPLIVFVLWAADAPAIQTSPTPRPRLDFSSGVCGDLADTLEPQVFIPVGCETALCCPGCPDAPIDWRIRVSGEPLESTLLNFENLSPEAARKLRIKGKARWEGSALRVWPGETVVSGFRHDPRAAPPLVTPRLFANRESLRKLREAAGREEAARKNAASLVDRPLGRMEVFVEQMMGKYPVSEARVAYNVKRCSDPLDRGDRILINNNISTDNTITLLDARDGTGTCLDDAEYRGSGIVNVGDLRPFDICTSETSIFSDDNGMFIRSPTIWTDSLTDEHIMNLPTMFRAPVAVWIVINESGAQERAERDMANANFIYNDQKVGFAFDATYANALPAASFANKGCAASNQIRASNFFRPDRINVYYIDNWTDPDLVRGEACWIGPPDNKPSSPGLIFVNRWAPPDTLAHEFGHVFSLDDLAALPQAVTNGIGTNNIMAGWTPGIIRSEFTIGQSFRMNVNSISMINVNGVRVGWGIRGNPPCFDATTSNRCPALARDVTPK